MFQFALYNQIYPIIIPNPQSFALSLTSNQYDYYQQRGLQKRRQKRANKTTNNAGKQNEAQRTALKEGLQKSLDASNKGFEILKKMGYEEGKPLGKDGFGITEPLAIAINDNPHSRAGFGQEIAIMNGAEKYKKKECTKVVAKKQPAIKAATPTNSPLSKREKQLIKLETDYREDIELLRLRLQAELSSTKSNNSKSLIIAHVAITNETICEEIFEIIHQYLINSLHVYKGNPFPMFHDIALVDNIINVVCEDCRSFEYLSQCITALSESLGTDMTTTRISPIGLNVYWFGVQMHGLVSGPESFRLQIKKHRFDLKADRWIIVTQQPCPKTNKTSLQIITDEHSAMLLIYRHSLKLFVCMQEIAFTLRGKIPLVN